MRQESTEYLVLEMGARGQGHLAELCTIARPDVSVVLNVGKAHLGEFGSQEDIARAKGELVEALPQDGVAVLNADDPLVRCDGVSHQGEGAHLRRVRRPTCASPTSTLDDLGRPTFTICHADEHTASVSLRLVGEHQALNAVAAAAAAHRGRSAACRRCRQPRQGRRDSRSGGWRCTSVRTGSR